MPVVVVVAADNRLIEADRHPSSAQLVVEERPRLGRARRRPRTPASCLEVFAYPIFPPPWTFDQAGTHANLKIFGGLLPL